MTGYVDLVGDREQDGSIKNWCNNSSVPSATILIEAQAWIYQKVRCRQMIATATGTLASGADTITLPTRYRQPIFLFFSGTASVGKHIPSHKPLDWVKAKWSYDGAGVRSTGRPQFWATDADNIQFEINADQAYSYDFLHYAALANLDNTTGTNFLTETYPKLLRAACMHFGYEFLKDDENKNYWGNVAMSEIFDVNADSDRELATTEFDMDITGDAGF